MLFKVCVIICIALFKVKSFKIRAIIFLCRNPEKISKIKYKISKIYIKNEKVRAV